MRIGPNRRALLLSVALTCVALASLGGIALADDHGDHDRARRALEEGRARPLVEILDKVRGELGGEVVGVELDREDGRYVYEFDVVTPEGRLRELHVDALTAEIVERENE